MNKLFVVFFLLLSSLIFKFNPVFSTVINPKIIESDLLDYFWTENEEYMCFNINALNGLKFDDDYYSLVIEEGQIFGVSITVPEDDTIIYDGNNQLKKIMILTSVQPIDLNHIKYRTVLLIECKALDEEGQINSIISETETTGTLIAKPIDWLESPLFFSFEDEENKCCICFRYFESES